MSLAEPLNVPFFGYVFPPEVEPEPEPELVVLHRGLPHFSLT